MIGAVAPVRFRALNAVALAGVMLFAGRGAAAAPGGPATAPPAAARAPAPPLFALRPLDNGVYAAIAPPGSAAGSNAGFVVGDDAVLVIDAFWTPQAARALLAEIRKITPLPVRYVVNTHHHIDHTGGDAVFREAGAIIIAHRNVEGWIHSENLHLFGDAITPERRAEVEALVEPDVLVDEGLTIRLGKRRIEVRHVLGHTGGDLIVHVPDTDVLFTGDMLWNRIPPNLIDSSVSEWLRTLEDFRSAPAFGRTTFVPGHGELGFDDGVDAFESYLKTLRDLVGQELPKGPTDDAIAAAVTPRMIERFKGWPNLDRAVPREARYMAAELRGRKRRPTPEG